MQLIIRNIGTADAKPASDLVQFSFLKLAAADWAPNARESFLTESSPIAMSQALQSPAFAASAFISGAMVGFILLPKPSYLSMLFVHPDFLRRGIARGLWEQARIHLAATFPEIKTVELNATPYALQFYRSVGFVPLCAEFTLDGCRATRMACWLPARALGATI